MQLITTVLAQCIPDPNNIYGCLQPPAGNIGGGGDPVIETGNFFTTVIRIVLLAAALLVLAYLLWGGIDWITSGGDKEKLTHAQQKITQALIGIVVLVLAFGIFGVVAGNILGLIKISGGALIFSLPTFNGG